MPTESALDPPWAQLSELIARRIGLNFPPKNHPDLLRGLAGAAAEFGFEDAATYADWLLSRNLKRSDLQGLVSHLTIGETYFFRERKAFDALRGHILPELIRRRGHDRHLRLWSAACCTGEEAYSLAIAVQECLPNLQDWRVTLLATDINERFLRKATAAVYGEWSFRDTPVTFRNRYFTRTPEGHFALLPQIRQCVTFAPLNLVEDNSASPTINLHNMDVIFCRNVLMYFTPAQARSVVTKLHSALLEGSWLVVSPSEGSHHLFSGFEQVSVAGALLYRKNGARVETASSWTPATVDPSPAVGSQLQVPNSWTSQLPVAVAADQAPKEAPTEADDAPPMQDSSALAEVQTLALQARALANQGQLQEALACCDRWIAADALDPASRYLRAVILQELGDPEQARRSLQQALYLHPDFVLAHFGLGNLARRAGKSTDAARHFANALALLEGRAPDDALPQSDGLTAGRLKEILKSLLVPETAS